MNLMDSSLVAETNRRSADPVCEKPLNPMQRAYLIGRSDQIPLGGVAMHDFREFLGSIDEENLSRSISAAIKKHACLRKIIDEQRLIEYEVKASETDQAAKHHFEAVDLSRLSVLLAAQALDKIRESYRNKVHSLKYSPWAICLVQMPLSSSEGKPNSVVFTSFDGLIVDGFTISQIIAEMFTGQSDTVAVPGIPNQNAHNSISYFDNREKDRLYWEQKVSSLAAVNQLPWKMDLELLKRSGYDRFCIAIEKQDWDKLSRLGFAQKLMQNALLLTLICEILALWTESGELALTLPVSSTSLNGNLGNNSSFILVSYSEDGKQTFVEKALAMQRQVLSAMEHVSFSGVEIGKLMLRHTSKMISLPIAFTNGLTWNERYGEGITMVDGITQTPQLAMDIRIGKNEVSDIVVRLDYATAALETSVVQEFGMAIKKRVNELLSLADLGHAIDPVVVEIDEPQNKLSVSSEQHRKNFLEKMFHNLLVSPLDKTALVCGQQKYSYQQVGASVGKIIHHLKSLGLQEGNVVAICLRKSPEHLFATLACALGGFIWVPIDMESPEERLSFLLSNCKADLALSGEPIGSFKSINIAEVLASDAVAVEHRHFPLSKAPAYYLYTSGSTGVPKCVVLNNQATDNVMQHTIAQWQLTGSDVFFAATPFHHDMSVFDAFAPWMLGASLVMPTEQEIKSAADWARLMTQHSVSIWCSVPAIVDMLLAAAEPRQLSSLRLIAQGGDYIKPAVIAKFRELLPMARLFSLGGPTETTIWSIWHEITAQDTHVIPYGNPLPNNKYYILNDRHQHCPDLVAGTICMGGINLSNGYLADGEIQKKDFVTVESRHGNPLVLFKTSDKGYMRQDGKIIFVGRKEGYLKVRGVRIASAEVESALRKIPNLKDAVVFTCVNPVYDGNELVAAYSSYNQEEISSKEFRQLLQAYLPNSHVPSRWLLLDEFPLTRNRKIDRKLLAQLAAKKIYQAY